ncbi:T9SS type A sorting domain-containing protein [Chryseobacterium jejuense]|uniref:Por secretion system C-terminal sorting domain n=1 Tax=Chryseobacterium jejuense TaxID=445960 RepID=A0A2X2Z923_CHRJE|nr:T9SS type A sorting domain-containing protein [Chryseobacterium jejuense]SDJ56102.1 Por secretion system C-terminal sorting domain-containing protein [Chryseobacterium jejuense]SQB46199.1 Por secretion system C-terminal sorting domain [Chryseobacterium jejuense]
MKKIILFLLGTSAVFSAQITLTKASHDPILNDIVDNRLITGTVDNSATGANVTFSNGSLTLGIPALVSYLTPAASEISTFPGSNIKMVEGATAILYKASPTKLEITGIVNPQVTLNLSMDNGTYINYPTTFGPVQNDTAKGTFTSSVINGICVGTTSTEADAYGTLILNSQTYNNVLRVKFTQNFSLHLPTDLTFANPLGTVTNTAYSYYDASHRYPLLSSTNLNISVPILGINQTTSTAMALNMATLAVSNTVKKESFSVYPNPAQDFIRFKGNTEGYSKANIYGLDGKLIKTADVNSGNIQISDLPPAPYFIEISGKNSETKKNLKFIKK